MVSIPVNEGTVTINHEWPVDKRVDKYHEGEPVVSLEVDTDLGTAVVGLTLQQVIDLTFELDEFYLYYQEIARDEWSSR